MLKFSKILRKLANRGRRPPKSPLQELDIQVTFPIFNFFSIWTEQSWFQRSQYICSGNKEQVMNIGLSPQNSKWFILRFQTSMGVEGGNRPKGCLNGREGWATGALQGDRSCHLTTYMGTQQTMSDLQRRLNVNVSDNLVLHQSKRPRGQ